MIDFEWLVEDETRSIPTLASKFLFYLPFLTARRDTPV